MAHTFDNETSARRISAYTAFLLEAYDTDLNGLADIAGVDRGELEEYANETDYDNLNCSVLSTLGNMTGISFSWLFAEKGGERPRYVGAASAGGAAIDADDFYDATRSVKACAAALTALYVQDAGRITYDAELYETLANLLHGAARYYDGVLGAL